RMIKLKIPALAVLGGKASGKTTAVEVVVKALTSMPLSVMTVKHVSQEGFTLDREGTDTWRHRRAGASVVAIVSSSERAVMIKNGGGLDLDELNSWTKNADAIVFEGFSSLLLGEQDVGKVICLKELAERDSYLSSLKGELVALCSITFREKDVLRLGLDDGILAERAVQFVRRWA
ncbi:molybdopterin-guanine dinucleotide biosynthesis protein B, partial [Candidatus Bathyarchaeota archaeon]|nr:molybdopterin-guanine dinucleotide biosynthesis protein B [Candidatus Bathyarchaeota archaeon]